jgi:hypothetical protein
MGLADKNAILQKRQHHSRKGAFHIAEMALPQ